MDNYIRLQSSEPVTDCGKKLSIIYVIGGIAVGLFFAFNAGNPLTGFLGGAVVGVILGWVIKDGVIAFSFKKFERMKFAVDNKIPYPELITQLNKTLVPLNMQIETDRDGSPSIKYKGIVYGVEYGSSGNYFTISWRPTIGRFLLFKLVIKDYISIYRKVSIAMGLIGYNTQIACNNTGMISTADHIVSENDSEKENIISEGIIYCTNCGHKNKAGTKFCSNCGSQLQEH